MSNGSLKTLDAVLELAVYAESELAALRRGLVEAAQITDSAAEVIDEDSESECDQARKDAAEYRRFAAAGASNLDELVRFVRGWTVRFVDCGHPMHLADPADDDGACPICWGKEALAAQAAAAREAEAEVARLRGSKGAVADAFTVVKIETCTAGAWESDHADSYAWRSRWWGPDHDVRAAFVEHVSSSGDRARQWRWSVRTPQGHQIAEHREATREEAEAKVDDALRAWCSGQAGPQIAPSFVHVDYDKNSSACGDPGPISKNPELFTCPKCWRRMWNEAQTMLE